MGSNNNTYSFKVQFITSSFAVLLIIVYAFVLMFTLRNQPHLFTAVVTQKSTTATTITTMTTTDNTRKEGFQNNEASDKHSDRKL